MTFLTTARRQIAMEQAPHPRPKVLNRQQMLSLFALMAVSTIIGGINLSAQTAKPGRQQRAAGQAHRRAAQVNAPSAQPQAAPEAMAAQPSAAPAPIGPGDQPPNKARVSWDSRGLEIEASNSSLNQILRQVAAHTGAKLQGLTEDQRVFGTYGPGPGSDVLLKLLDGSGYNVLMVGGRDGEAPLEIILSTRSPFSPQTAVNHQNRSNAEDDAADRLRPEPQPDPPPPADQNPFNIGGPPRDPVEVMDEILHRQQKIDEQTQEQQNNPQQ